MENTIIIKEDGRAINSDDCDNYALVVTDLGGEVTSSTPDVLEQVQEIPLTIELRAAKAPDTTTQIVEDISEVNKQEISKPVHISTFYDIQEASNALLELIEHIKSEIEIFDVREYNSNV